LPAIAGKAPTSFSLQRRGRAANRGPGPLLQLQPAWIKTPECIKSQNFLINAAWRLSERVRNDANLYLRISKSAGRMMPNPQVFEKRGGCLAMTAMDDAENSLVP
jgi:hypothetical protein